MLVSGFREKSILYLLKASSSSSSSSKSKDPENANEEAGYEIILFGSAVIGIADW